MGSKTALREGRNELKDRQMGKLKRAALKERGALLNVKRRVEEKVQP